MKFNSNSVNRVYFRLFLVMLLMPIIGLTAWATLRYPGNPFVFFIFSIAANAMLIYGFRKKAIFFDKLFSFFLWLGFWPKFSLGIIFTNKYFYGLNFFDKSLILSSAAFVAIMVASWCRERFIFNYPAIIEDIGTPGLYHFYLKFRVWVLSVFVLAIVFFPLTNVIFGFYQRGEIPQVKLPFGLNGIYTWLLMFGLATVSAVILRFEFERNKKTTYTPAVLALFESFFSSASMLSRAMVINVIAIGYGAFVGLKAYSIQSNWRYLRNISLLTIILLVISVSVVNHMRINYYSDAYTATASTSTDNANGEFTLIKKPTQETISTIINMTTQLLVDRWVGIEGVLNIVKYGNPSWELWKQAWAEKYSDHKISLYDQIIHSQYLNVDTSKNHFINLPGIVAFLFYPGSYAFLFFSLIAVVMLASILEYSAYKLGGKNLILSALIAQIIVFRLTNFGYVPSQSYLLFGTIIINLLLIYVADKLLSRRGDLRNVYLASRTN